MNNFSVEAGKALTPDQKYVLIQVAEEALNQANEDRRKLLLESMVVLAEQLEGAIHVHVPSEGRNHALDPVSSVKQHARNLRANWNDDGEREKLHYQVARISDAVSRFNDPENESGPLYGESRIAN